MARDDERQLRASEEPIVGGLPDAPGILAAIRLTPSLAAHLRGLADELLVRDYPGTTLTRAERELLATAVSAANDCFYCMDSHGAFATELLQRTGTAFEHSGPRRCERAEPGRGEGHGAGGTEPPPLNAKSQRTSQMSGTFWPSSTAEKRRPSTRRRRSDSTYRKSTTRRRW